MRKHLVPILMFVGILALGAYSILNTPFILCRLLPEIIEKHSRDTKVISLTAEGQSFRLPFQATLHNISCRLEKGGVPYQIDVYEMTIYDVVNVSGGKKHVRLGVNNLTMTGGRVRVFGLNLKTVLDLQNKLIYRFDGIFALDMLNVARYHIEGVSGRFRGDPRKVQVFEISSLGYGGNGRGQLSLERGRPSNSVFWMEYFGMDADKMEILDQGIFSSLKGKVNGSVRILKKGEKVTLLTLDLALHKGGEIAAPLLKQLGAKAMDQYRDVLLSRETLTVDRAQLHIQNVGKKKLVVMANVDNRELNLHVKETWELGLEKGLDYFLIRGRH